MAGLNPVAGANGAAGGDGEQAATRSSQSMEAPVAPAGLENVRVNDPRQDGHQQDQTTQSETSVAVTGRSVVVGFNDSQQALLFPTAGASLSGFASSSNGGESFVDGGALPNTGGGGGGGAPVEMSGLAVGRSIDAGGHWTLTYAAKVPTIQQCPNDPNAIGFTQFLGAQPFVNPPRASSSWRRRRSRRPARAPRARRATRRR